MAFKCIGARVDMKTVRLAARNWYHQDKAILLKENTELEFVLNFIIEEVIGKRKARAFLFPSNIQNNYLERLFDARIIHLLKRNIYSNDSPGKRFNVFKIDYGCYAELTNTAKATQGLFETDDNWVEVPADDYRSIRRAILEPERLEHSLQNRSSTSQS